MWLKVNFSTYYYRFWIQNLPFFRLVAVPRLRSQVCSSERWIHAFLKGISEKGNLNIFISDLNTTFHHVSCVDFVVLFLNVCSMSVVKEWRSFGDSLLPVFFVGSLNYQWLILQVVIHFLRVSLYFFCGASLIQGPMNNSLKSIFFFHSGPTQLYLEQHCHNASSFGGSDWLIEMAYQPILGHWKPKD